MATRKVWALVSVLLGLATAGCSSSSSRMPVAPPADPDPDATYCLVWVPPAYREVPRVVPCGSGHVRSERAERVVYDFEEVVKPGCYEAKCTPDRCRTTQEIEATPARREWVKVECCGPDGQDCYRSVEVPPTYRVCEKTVTEKGVEYCAFTPPQYDVVAHERRECIERPVYVPPEYRVVYERECFEAGHWEWQKRYTGCSEPARPCAPAPAAPSCGGCRVPRRGDFSHAPSPN